MRLERMHIQGFKSFKDRTTFHFDDGITGIVGPNGCGKSNIVDALFWVMGEQSAKHLRGQKMSDLIFSGSKKYNPASFAEVSLVLNNTTKKHIHISNKVVAPQEIELTRKLYRNGDTEYRINGMPARLKDIQEVFMDTGAGAKSYSIIAQGEIDALVKAKPVERRVMIEEVAGITKFKQRKKESLRKIEQTQLNIERINDLKREVYKQLKTLEAQAEKAEKAKRLRDKVKKHSLIYHSHKELDLLEKMIDYHQTLKSNTEAVEEYEVEKKNLDASLAVEKTKKSELIDTIDEQQETYNQKSRDLVSYEEKVKSLERAIEDKENYVSEREEETDVLAKDLTSRTEKLNEVVNALSGLTGESAQTSFLVEREKEISAIKKTLAEQEKNLSKFEKERNALFEEFRSVEARAFQNTSELEQRAKTLEETTKEISELEDYFAKMNREVEAKKSELETTQSEKQRAEHKLATVDEQLKTQEDKISQCRKQIEPIREELISHRSRLNSLEELVETFSTSGASKEYCENNAAARLLRDVINFDEEYYDAVEALLHPYWDAVVFEEDADSQDAIKWSAKNEKNILFIKDYATLSEYEISKGIPLKEIAKIKPGFAHIDRFLNGFYISENPSATMDDGAIAACNSAGTELYRSLGDVALVSVMNGQTEVNRLEIGNEVEKLKEKISSAQVDLDRFEQDLLKFETEKISILKNLDSIKSEYEQTKEKCISLESSLPSKSDSFSINEERLENLKRKKKELSNARLDLNESEETLGSQKQELSQKLNDMDAEIDRLRTVLTTEKNDFEKARDTLVELRSDVKSHDFKRVQFSAQLEDLENQKVSIEAKIQANQKAIDKAKESLEEFKNEIVEHGEVIAQLTDELKAQETNLSELKDELAVLTKAMEDREKRARELGTTINKLNNDTTEKKVKLEKFVEDEELLVKDIFEQYRVDLRTTILDFLQVAPDNFVCGKEISDMYYMETENGMTRIEVEAYDFEKRFPGQVSESKEKFKNYRSQLNRIGHVNWQAIEDYDRQKLRYDFLKDQEEELNQSIKDLIVAINKIDEKSKIRFQKAYHEVNSRFEKVFPIIFGGGHASLQMVGHIDQEDFGVEIVASPPGKKMQNINLMSGGEKALTAVALIFSIFLVKPSPFCLLDEVDAPLDDANVGRFNQLLREMSVESQFILITHNKKTMELNDRLYGITMQEPGVSSAVTVQLH